MNSTWSPSFSLSLCAGVVGYRRDKDCEYDDYDYENDDAYDNDSDSDSDEEPSPRPEASISAVPIRRCRPRVSSALGANAAYYFG